MLTQKDKNCMTPLDEEPRVVRIIETESKWLPGPTGRESLLFKRYRFQFYKTKKSSGVGWW